MRRTLLPLVCCLALGAGTAHAAAPVDPEHADTAHRCVKKPTRGALALVAWLQRHVRGEFWGIMRCERLSKHSMSLHSEGRAVDWHLDNRMRADRAAARALIDRLLATDGTGENHALARRMGVQEIIWNCRYWGAGMERPGPYSLCFDRRGKPRRKVDRTAAHRDHVHIGLNRAGAAMRTSFWRSRRL